MSDRIPFNGLFESSDGRIFDLASMSEVEEEVDETRVPFYGVFTDKDGKEHDIFELSIGGGGTGTESDPVFKSWRDGQYQTDIAESESKATSVSKDLSTHIEEDSEARWPAVNKAIADLRAELKQYVQNIYSGITPQYDYSQTQTILMAGGLVSLVDQGSWTVPTNGAIQAQVGGLLGAGLQILVNGNTVWAAPLNLLLPLNSPEIQVNAGDDVSYTGVVGLGQTIQVDYFPNKGT